jgi:A/G-specific adenine glycosylase
VSLLDSAPQKKFLKALLSWYRKFGRHDMPWRKTKDAYAIFVSEYMLQQTTVSTVRPYFERFMKKFPTIHSLAKGDLNHVLALWSGLGYYARARNLWLAMRIIEENYRGKIPSDARELQKLPGVGAYTSGAIASFAFNQPSVVLDGNTIRLFMRILAIDDDPRFRAVQMVLERANSDLIQRSMSGKKNHRLWQKGGPRDVNLALMDLGSMVCLPKNPLCVRCPAAGICLAKKYGKQNDIPLRGEKTEIPIVRRLFAVVEHQGKWLMGQRPKQGLFGGLWEFMGVDAPGGLEPVPFLEENVRRETGLSVRVRQALPAFDHQLSHRLFVVRPFLCERIKKDRLSSLNRRGADYDRFRWVSPTAFHRMGISSVTKKIITALNKL